MEETGHMAGIEIETETIWRDHLEKDGVVIIMTTKRPFPEEVTIMLMIEIGGQ
jgi:hypothetical protein